jgi:hypothetical protein
MRKATRGTRGKPAAPIPDMRELTIIGQDPSVKSRGRILTASIRVPMEQLGEGPRGYRVQVVDYDASSHRMYKPLPREAMGSTAAPKDPYLPPTTRGMSAVRFNTRLLTDPRFHAQNVYAIVMRTLGYFEKALGRRVNWSFGGHQLKVAPHAFAEPNAFYSKRDEGLFFGYFAGRDGPVFTCLSHDIVVHETTHALVDGLRPRLMEPSSPDQAAFHEGFADVVALLSVFSLPQVLREAVRQSSISADGGMMRVADLTVRALQEGMLFGLGEQFGETLSGVHGSSLRRSVQLRPHPDLPNRPEYQQEHRRGEILVASLLRAFLAVFKRRLATLGRTSRGQLPPIRIAEEGADIAGRMLTMCIRALDYMPPTDLEFGDVLSALITSDLEIRPDDTRYRVRDALRRSFAAFGIQPTSRYGSGDSAGRWEPPGVGSSGRAQSRQPLQISYDVIHRDSLQRDTDEVFRFLWENRSALGLCEQAYTVVAAVRPCLRIDEDGFTLRETVADYVQILTVPAAQVSRIEIPGRRDRIRTPKGLPGNQVIRLLGGGALLFDEFGRLKYHIRNAVLNPGKQTRRLKHLQDAGFFGPARGDRGFAALHLKGMGPELPAATREATPWR